MINTIITLPVAFFIKKIGTELIQTLIQIFGTFDKFFLIPNLISSTISVKSWFTADHCCYYQFSSNHSLNYSNDKTKNSAVSSHWVRRHVSVLIVPAQ